MSCVEWTSMRAMDTIGIVYLPDYTAATISSALAFLSRGWVEVELCEAVRLMSSVLSPQSSVLCPQSCPTGWFFLTYPPPP